MAASGLGLPARTSEALRARAAVLLAAGDSAGATRAARIAAREAHRVGNRLDAARAQLLAGQALAAGGHHREATVALTRRPRDVHRRRRAPLRRPGRARAAPARPPRRPPGPRAAGGPRPESARSPTASARSPQLLADGHTNRRIAAHLHLSTKTVETHVANIFGKLGVRSRAAVAATIART